MTETIQKRKRIKISYLVSGQIEELHYTKMLASKNIKAATFPRFLNGVGLTTKTIKKYMTHPIVIEKPDVLGMKMPGRELSPRDVSEMCGREKRVSVLEVSTQTERFMTLRQYADYFMSEGRDEERILNVITLEIGGSALGDMCKRPVFVEEMDWVDLAWPKELIEQGTYPKVQVYCLMSVKDSYTEYLFFYRV